MFDDSLTRIADAEAIRRSNVGFKDQLATKVAELFAAVDSDDHILKFEHMCWGRPCGDGEDSSTSVSSGDTVKFKPYGVPGAGQITIKVTEVLGKSAGGLSVKGIPEGETKAKEFWVDPGKAKIVPKGDETQTPTPKQESTKTPSKQDTSNSKQAAPSVPTTAPKTPDQDFKEYKILKANLQNGVNGLSGIAKTAHDIYTSKSVENATTYKQMNGALRTGKTNSLVAGMDDAFKEGSVSLNGRTLYRGISNQKVVEGLKVGATYTDKGFSSTSLDKDMSLKFSGKKGALIEITPKTQTKGLQGEPNENEVILNRGTGIKVTSITMAGGIKHIKAEEI